jgi:3',5'-cyclic AMP phosphodiesterase CpdA
VIGHRFPLALLVFLAPLVAGAGEATLRPAGPESPRPAAPAAAEARFFFIQMSDPQFGFFEENRGFSKETRNFTRAVAHLNRLKPAFVVITGDLVHRPGDMEQAREYLRILSTVDPSIPVHSAPGNHDVGNTPTPKLQAWFRKTIGPDHGSFKHQGSWFIYLNSSLIIDPKLCASDAEAERLWLEGELRRGRGEKPRHIILFQHHPWFVERVDEPDSHYSVPRSVRGPYLKLLEAAGARATFAGHLHRCSEASGAGMEMVASGAVGKPMGKDPSGLRVVWVFDDRIEHRYYGLEETPEKIDLKGPARKGAR